MAPAARTGLQTLTTTEGAVLALLATEGEHSGYELAKFVDQAIGHLWSPARSGLYATLARVARNGLAESRAVAQPPRPDKQLYRISAAGLEALAAWLEGVEPGARDTFFLKLFVGVLTSPDVLLEHVEQFRADTEGRLAVLRRFEATNSNTGHDWFYRHLLDYGIRRAELELEWVDGVAQALRDGPQ